MLGHESSRFKERSRHSVDPSLTLPAFEAVAGLREVSGLAMSTAGEVVFDGPNVEAAVDRDPVPEISAASFRFLATNAASSSAELGLVSCFDADEEVETDFSELAVVGGVDFESRCCVLGVAGPERVVPESSDVALFSCLRF
jgi:hypothetical protein